jgi:integrase
LRAISFQLLRSRLLLLYTPPMRAPSTFGAMTRLLERVGAMKGVKQSSHLTQATVAKYIAERSKTVCANTIVGELGYLKAVCSWAAEEGYLKVSPFRAKRCGPGDWLRPTMPRRKPYHSLVELARALGHLRGAAVDWPGRRLFTLASLVALTGLRRDEALYAQLDDLDLSTGIFRVMGHRRLKTPESAAPVPLCAELREVLAAWLPEAGPVWLFPGLERVGPWTGGMPGRKPLDRLKQAGKAAGVDHLTFQSLRHSWATHAETAWGLSDAMITRVLRHTTGRTSREHYRHADLVNLATAVRSITYRAAG